MRIVIVIGRRKKVLEGRSVCLLDRLQCLTSTTGRLLWEQRIDANGHAIPITYLGKDGKQYVVIGVPMAWSPGTEGVVTGTPVIAVLKRSMTLKHDEERVDRFIQEHKVKTRGIDYPDGPASRCRSS